MDMSIRIASHATGYVPKPPQKEDGWTHWNILVRRWRFSSGGDLRVEVFFFNARKEKGEWVSVKRPSFVHEISLGDSDDAAVKGKLRTVEVTRKGIEKPPEEFGESYLTYPQVVKELESAVSEIEKIAVVSVKKGAPMCTECLNRILLKACLRPDALTAA